MGSSITGSTLFKYRTKEQGIPIEYIYYDLKGKSRYPPTPQREQLILANFEICLADIETTPQKFAFLRDLSVKYKHRFTIKHRRAIDEFNQLKRLSNPNSYISQNKELNIKLQLHEKISNLQELKGIIKIELLNIQKYIQDQKAHKQFLEVDGINRLLVMLEKQITHNLQSTKTNFSNQIQILRFLKVFSARHTKEYFSFANDIEKYGLIILKSFHPINVGVTAYCLSLLEDYLGQETRDFIQIMKESVQIKGQSFLKRFADCLDTTNNILMVYYNLKFINSLVAFMIDDGQKKILDQELVIIKYEIILQNITVKLEEGFYKLQYCTFTYVHQQIFQYATKVKSKKQDAPVLLRNTVKDKNDTNDLQDVLLATFINMDHQDQRQQSMDDDKQFITIYLDSSSKKQFNSFLLDILPHIQNFYKLRIYKNQQYLSQSTSPIISKTQLEQSKLQQYVKIIRTTCIKNSCSDVMIETMKSLQYYDKSQWKKLQNHVKSELGVGSKTDELQSYKKTIEEKQNVIKKLYKENQTLKHASNNTLILPSQNVGIQRVSNINNNVLSPPPSLDVFNLPPPPPPPPSTNSLNNQSISNGTLLPPPPQLSDLILPPPPPPPTTVGSNILNLSSTGLPLPPSLDILGLPPPPPSNTFGLPPPPPPLNGVVLPPPPSLSGLGLPPPISGLGLPPPSISSLGLPTPPPLSNGLGLVNNTNIKIKQKKKPSVALKACNYTTLGYEKISGTIWQKLDDQKVDLNFKYLEDMFCKNVDDPKEIKAQSAIVQKVAKKQAIKLLGSDRWRNIEIVLTKLKLPAGKVKEGLLTCSGKNVSLSNLQSISKILPTQDQEQLIKNYAGDINDLGAPQKFYLQLMEVPNYAARVHSMVFSSMKEEFFIEINSKIDDLTSAFNSLQQNYRLHYILEVTLAIGNYLNGTNLKGGAWGFKLDTLERIQEVKSKDNKLNAAHCVIQQVWKKYTYPIFDKEEIDQYNYLTKMPISQVNAELIELKKYATYIDKALKSQTNDSNDMIGPYCQEMSLEVNSKVETFKQKKQQLDESYYSCATFYCQDGKKMASDEFGKKIFKSILFISNTEKILKELQEKQRKQQSRKASKIQQTYSHNKKQLNVNSNKITQTNPQSNGKNPTISINMLNLPKPPEINNRVSKQDKKKQFEKTLQDREKKALDQIMKKRMTKLNAIRKSQMPQGKVVDNNFDDIAFLNNVK